MTTSTSQTFQVQAMTLGFVPTAAASSFVQKWITDAIAGAPLVTMLIVRSCESSRPAPLPAAALFHL